MNQPSPTIIALGGEEISIRLADGSEETVKVRLFKLAEFPEYLRRVDDEEALAEFACAKEPGWAATLDLDSLLDIIEKAGGRPDRFISIHTQAEPDFDMHKAVAARGAWIEYDHIGSVSDEDVVTMILRALDAGLETQLLLSHDRGWFDPAQPGGGIPQPYTHLVDHFLPALRETGVSETTIAQLTQDNPFRAFAR